MERVAADAQEAPAGFPPCLVYTWVPQKTALEDVTALTHRVSLLATTHSMPWSIEITSKFPLQKKKQLVTQAPSSSARIASNSKHPPTAAAGAGDDVALNFVSFSDIQLCAVVPRAKKPPAGAARKPLALVDVDVVGLVAGCEDAWLKGHGKKETEWTTRAAWRCSGTRFLYADAYLVSLGFVEHSGAPPRPCLEVTYVPGPHDEDVGGDEDGDGGPGAPPPPRVVAQLHSIATDLFSTLARTDIAPGLAGSAETGNACLAQTVASRAAQWVSIL